MIQLNAPVLLTSAILAMDKVDNTMGHQVAYLKNWPKRSYTSVHLEVPALIPTGKPCHVESNAVSLTSKNTTTSSISTRPTERTIKKPKQQEYGTDPITICGPLSVAMTNRRFTAQL